MKANLQTKRKIISTVCLFLTAIIWGMSFVAQCDSADKINPFLFNGIRFIIGSLILIPVIIFVENRNEKISFSVKPFKVNLFYGIIGGTILAIASALQQYGIVVNPNAGRAGFITGIYTVLVPIFYLIFFRRKTKINVWIGAFCAALGLYFLSGFKNTSGMSLSDSTLLIGAVFWAIHIIAIDLFINKVGAVKFSSIQFFVCGIWNLIIAFAVYKIPLTEVFSQFSAAIVPILYAGILSSGIAYTLQAIGQKNADPTYAAIILSCESLFAAIGGIIFGTDKGMSLEAYLGCLIIFIGLIVSQISPEKVKLKRKRIDQ